MNKVAYEIWEIIKGDKSYKLLLPIGCDAGEALSVLYELRLGVLEEIKRIEASIKPAEPVETPVEVVANS